jgi:hypothetical protein
MPNSQITHGPRRSTPSRAQLPHSPPTLSLSLFGQVVVPHWLLSLSLSAGKAHLCGLSGRKLHPGRDEALQQRRARREAAGGGWAQRRHLKKKNGAISQTDSW